MLTAAKSISLRIGRMAIGSTMKPLKKKHKKSLRRKEKRLEGTKMKWTTLESLLKNRARQKARNREDSKHLDRKAKMTSSLTIMKSFLPKMIEVVVCRIERVIKARKKPILVARDP
jgi:hypothetical protein